MANLKENPKSINLGVDNVAIFKNKELKENFSAKLESRPKRSFNVEGPSFPFWL